MRPADLTPVARDVMKGPASLGLIFFSLLGAYVLDVLPWSGAWLLARPDFVLLVLLFWSVNEPRAVGQGAAFFVGLLMDVSDSMLLGQHAFAYVLAVFGAQIFRVRILSFHLPEQTLHILAPAFAASAMMLMLNLSLETWLRFAIWMVLGFVIYALYGYRKSRVGLEERTGQAQKA